MAAKYLLALGTALSLTAWTPGALATKPGEDEERDVIPVDELKAAPTGFHVEQRLRWGRVIAGGTMVGIGGACLAVGLKQRAELQRNPVEQTPGSGGEIFIIAGIPTLAIGATLLIHGLISPQDVYVRDSPPRLSWSIAPSSQGAHAQLQIAF